MLETGLGGRVCLVTGAAGGIGRACAALLAQEGAELVLVDVAIDEEAEPAAIRLQADLCSREDVARVFQAIDAAHGRLDVVVHCAGIYRVTPFLDVEDDEWSLVMDTNLRSAFLVTQAAIPMMQRQGDGRIVLFGSAAARTGGVAAGGVHYTAAKAGIAGLARNVANFAGPFGIRINVVSPGFTETPMSARLGREAAEQAAANTPLRRVAKPEEQAAIAVVLVSDLASFVHGQTIDVNGGTFMI